MTAHASNTESDAESAALAEDLGSIENRRPFQLGALVGALVVVAVVLLIVQNSHTTAFEWLWLDFDAPLWLLLVATFASGMVVAEAVRLLWSGYRSRTAERRGVVAAARRRLQAH